MNTSSTSNCKYDARHHPKLYPSDNDDSVALPAQIHRYISNSLLIGSRAPQRSIHRAVPLPFGLRQQTTFPPEPTKSQQGKYQVERSKTQSLQPLIYCTENNLLKLAYSSSCDEHLNNRAGCEAQFAVTMSVRFLNVHFIPSNILKAIQRGDEAIAGRPEEVPSHRFPPTAEHRTIRFRGKYILIVNQETDDQKTFKENISDFTPFEVPAGYTCYVRGATIYFEV